MVCLSFGKCTLEHSGVLCTPPPSCHWKSCAHHFSMTKGMEFGNLILTLESTVVVPQNMKNDGWEKLTCADMCIDHLN